MGRLAGKVAFISGTGAGIGRAAAQVFAAEGAAVFGCDIDADADAETVDLVTRAGGRMRSVAPVDLSTQEGAAAWIAAGIEAFGGLDILYNNASALRNGPFETMPAEDWYFTLRNELDIPYFCTQAAWPHLIARGGGAVLNVASVAAVRGAPATATHLMLVGHNPGLEHVATLLAREPVRRKERARHEALEEKFPTCALAILDFDIGRWRDVEKGAGKLVDFVRPKDL